MLRTVVQRAGQHFFAILIGLATFILITIRVFEISALDQVGTAIQAVQDGGWILFINLLVGMSIALFVLQLGWGALRVTLTVLVALLLGYAMTAVFNFDASSRFTNVTM